MIGANHAIAFASAFLISFTSIPLIRRYAVGRGWYDQPDGDRKVHTRPIPRLGGVGIIVAFLAVALFFTELDRPMAGLLGGLLIVFSIGVYDDIRGLSAFRKLGWQVVAALVVLCGGVGIVSFTSPIGGGVVRLDGWQIPIQFSIVDIGWLQEISFNIIPLGNVITVLWIVGLINSINFLDGLDGLVGGVGAIGALVMYVLAIGDSINNPVVAVLSIILAGSLFGFLPHNFQPASIFLGDGGAYGVGLLMATLSIYSGSKLAVGSFVFSLTIVDAVWAALRRILQGKSPFAPDRGHLHHILYDRGLSHSQVAIVMYTCVLLLAAAVLYGGEQLAFITLGCILVLIFGLIRLLGRGQP